MEWETKEGFPNKVLSGEGFYISFNPSPVKGLMGSDFGSSETALYIRHSRLWLILNGDFTKEYEEAFPKGLKACVEVYQKNRKHRSSWSTDQKDDKSFLEWIQRRGYANGK